MRTNGLSELGAEEVIALVENAIPEGIGLEYKQTLPGNDHRAKREFLADVSALANSGGGLIIFGIAEDPEKGTPLEVTGLDTQNSADETTRLSMLLAAAIEPRIDGIRFQWIELTEGQRVLVLAVPMSWQAPHRVILEGHDKFYARSANHKYPMDTSELRRAFTRRLEVEFEIRERRSQRIVDILENRNFLTFGELPRFALFLVPLIRGGAARTVDTRQLRADDIRPFLPPAGSIAVSTHENFDGRLWYYKCDQPWVRTYVQLFRDGMVESVTDSLFYREGDMLFPASSYENSIAEMAAHYLRHMVKLGVGGAVVLSLALIGVSGLALCGRPGEVSPDETYRAQSDSLVSPEVLLEGIKENIRAEELREQIRPCLVPFQDAFFTASDWL